MRDKEKAYCFLISFFCFVTYTAVGQDQKVADSLKRIYQKDSLQDSLKLRLLKDLAFNETNDYRFGGKIFGRADKTCTAKERQRLPV